jgi:DNA primase
MQPSTNIWQAYSPTTSISAELEAFYAKQVMDYYHKSLLSNPEALDYVSKELGIQDFDVLKAYRIGFVDRTFPRTLPERETMNGEMVRGFYERLQIVNGETGHETFRGMIFVPIFDEGDKLIGAYGQRKASFPVAKRGNTQWAIAPEIQGRFFNHAVLSSFSNIILCETPFDVISLNLGGYHNAISLIDFTYFDDEHMCELLEHDIKVVTIAFSRTPRGDRYFAHVRRKLTGIDIKVTKLDMSVGESVSSIWAKSQLFNQLTQKLDEVSPCPSNCH